MFCLLSFLFLSNVYSVLGNECGNGITSFYASNHKEINNIENCTKINGNLFINGGYDINTLKNLNNIQNITGYMVILDSHSLNNLKGLENLKEIGGNDLYLNKYALVIKHNNNNLDDNHHGLCYYNSVNWSNIVKKGDISIMNNGVNCGSCHNECLNCFGPGPYLCQNCNYYKISNLCTKNCTSLSNNNCILSLPTPPIINFTTINYNSVNISWYDLNNDIIKYELYLDNALIYETSVNDNHYTYINTKNYFNLVNLNETTTYQFHVIAYNIVGNSNISSYSYTTFQSPTLTPTKEPTNSPTLEPTNTPTLEPTNSPTLEPTNTPTLEPTNYPNYDPTLNSSTNTHTSKSNNDILNTLEIVLITIGVCLFLLIIFCIYKYKKYKEKKNNEIRLSRLQGRIIERSQQKTTTLGFENPVYNYPGIQTSEPDFDDISSDDGI